MNTKMKVVSGFLIGAAVGTATGLLLAPRSGKKTRMKIKDETKRMADDAVKKANESIDSAKKALNQKIDQYRTKGKPEVDAHLEALNSN